MSGARWGHFSVRNSNQSSHVWQRNSPATSDRTTAEAEFDLSNSPYSFILGLMSVFSCFGTGNRRFQTVCMACRRALERVPGIDMQVS